MKDGKTVQTTQGLLLVHIFGYCKFGYCKFHSNWLIIVTLQLVNVDKQLAIKLTYVSLMFTDFRYVQSNVSINKHKGICISTYHGCIKIQEMSKDKCK